MEEEGNKTTTETDDGTELWRQSRHVTRLTRLSHSVTHSTLLVLVRLTSDQTLLLNPSSSTPYATRFTATYFMQKQSHCSFIF